MSDLKPTADIKFKVRTYTDKDGKEKGVWLTVGTLFSSPHGSHQSIKIDTIPAGEWNGWLSVYPREEQDRPLTQHEVLKKANDVLPDDDITAGTPVDLSEIPF